MYQCRSYTHLVNNLALATSIVLIVMVIAFLFSLQGFLSERGYQDDEDSLNK